METKLPGTFVRLQIRRSFNLLSQEKPTEPSFNDIFPLFRLSLGCLGSVPFYSTWLQMLPKFTCVQFLCLVSPPRSFRRLSADCRLVWPFLAPTTDELGALSGNTGDSWADGGRSAAGRQRVARRPACRAVPCRAEPWLGWDGPRRAGVYGWTVPRTWVEMRSAGRAGHELGNQGWQNAGVN